MIKFIVTLAAAVCILAAGGTSAQAQTAAPPSLPANLVHPQPGPITPIPGTAGWVTTRSGVTVERLATCSGAPGSPCFVVHSDVQQIPVTSVPLTATASYCGYTSTYNDNHYYDVAGIELFTVNLDSEDHYGNNGCTTYTVWRTPYCGANWPGWNCLGQGTSPSSQGSFWNGGLCYDGTSPATCGADTNYLNEELEDTVCPPGYSCYTTQHAWVYLRNNTFYSGMRTETNSGPVYSN